MRTTSPACLAGASGRLPARAAHHAARSEASKPATAAAFPRRFSAHKSLETNSLTAWPDASVSLAGFAFSAKGGRPRFLAGFGVSREAGASTTGEATAEGLPSRGISSPRSSIGVRGASGENVCGSTGRNCLDWSALEGLPRLRVPGGSRVEAGVGGPVGVAAPAWPRAGGFGWILTCCVSSLGKGRSVVDADTG